MFAPIRLFQPSLICYVCYWSLPKRSISQLLLALLTNTRLGCKSQPGTNTQGYWDHSKVTKKIKRIVNTALHLFCMICNILKFDLRQTHNLIHFCGGLHYKSFMIINYDRKVRSKLWHHLLTMLESQFTIPALARFVICSFIVLASVITIVNYNCTVITIVNYNCTVFSIVSYDSKTFTVQDTDHIQGHILYACHISTTCSPSPKSCHT